MLSFSNVYGVQSDKSIRINEELLLNLSYVELMCVADKLVNDMSRALECVNKRARNKCDASSIEEWKQMEEEYLKLISLEFISEEPRRELVNVIISAEKKASNFTGINPYTDYLFTSGISSEFKKNVELLKEAFSLMNEMLPPRQSIMVDPRERIPVETQKEIKTINQKYFPTEEMEGANEWQEERY